MSDGDIVLQGGRVVTVETIREQDILIRDGRIEAVGERLAGQALDAAVVDVRGLTILPGLVDVHVHLREPGGEHKENFHSGTSAALAGGVTTVCAMPNTSPPVTGAAAFYDALARAERSAVCDFGLYVGATPDNAAEVAQIREAVALKMYIGSSTGSLLVDQFPAQITHFERYPADRIIAVHAEEESAVQHYAAHGVHRPPICAALSVARVIALAEQVSRRLHICHVSTGYEVTQIRAAKGRGAAITCEVTPHHLFLSTEDEGRLGALARVNPPLRAPADVAALWEGLDVFDMMATDHAPHTLEEKASASPPSGMPGLESFLPLLLTAAHEGRLRLPEIVRWTAAGPAEVFGFAAKGHIAPGYDADLALVDLAESWVMGNEGLYTRCGWTPFAGRTMQGRVRGVYLRGQLVFKDGQVLAAPGTGRRAIN
ncbi:MAG: dihydroorotase [Anaerolineae bacterium]